jgi:hypothetical protein
MAGAPMAGAAAAAARRYLEEQGVQHVGHSRSDARMPGGSFLDHLVAVEDLLRAWGCGEAVCLAGLYHSIYGTEGFQGFTLPIAERAAVRALTWPLIRVE